MRLSTGSPLLRWRRRGTPGWEGGPLCGVVRRSAASLVACLCMLSVVGSAAANDGVIPGGTVMTAGTVKYSQNSLVMLNMQHDGNLVLYSMPSATPLWESATQGAGAWAAFQTNGDFVVYSATYQPLWHSHTGDTPGSLLKVQDDGKVVIYRPDLTVRWQGSPLKPRAGAPPPPVGAPPAPSPPVGAPPATSPDPEGLGPLNPQKACTPWAAVGRVKAYETKAVATYRLRARPTVACAHDGVRWVRKNAKVTVTGRYGRWSYVKNQATGRSGWMPTSGLAAAAGPAQADCSPKNPKKSVDYFVQARTSSPLGPRPGCPSTNTFEVGDIGHVTGSEGSWLYLKNNNTGKSGWVKEADVARVPKPKVPSKPSRGGQALTVLQQVACFIADFVLVAPSLKAYDLALNVAASLPCGDSSDGLVRCQPEAGNTFSCPWEDQEPYKTRIEAWQAKSGGANGRTKAVDETVEAVEAAYMNCLWIAATYGPDHWALGSNHGGCLLTPTTRPSE